MPAPTVFYHVSDLHLGPLPRLTLAQTNLKRSLGALNWWRKRRHLHLDAAWQAILADLKAHRHDHVAVTGDLANLGTAREGETALATLAAIGPPSTVTVVPGNHDVYTTPDADAGIAHWRPYMRADGNGADHTAPSPSAFPFVRRVGAVAIIGLNSAHPMPPGRAAGRLGTAQIQALRTHLADLGRAGLFRLVMIHHPPLPGQAPPARALEDAADLRSALVAEGAELVIHGHNHRDMLERLETRTGHLIAVGVGSSSAAMAYGDEPPARAAIYRITPAPHGFAVEIERRGLEVASGKIVTVARETLVTTSASSGQKAAY
jgi:3',5'-cyclic AMP phosphodiesterase CpdA